MCFSIQAFYLIFHFVILENSRKYILAQRFNTPCLYSTLQTRPKGDPDPLVKVNST